LTRNLLAASWPALLTPYGFFRDQPGANPRPVALAGSPLCRDGADPEITGAIRDARAPHGQCRL
jgi:hypothetical protein